MNLYQYILEDKKVKWIANLIRVIFFGLFIFVIAKGNMMLWLAFFAASLVLAVLFGRLYCGYACPMNTVMLPAEWISKKLKLSKEAPKWLEKGIFPWVFLVLSVAVMMISKQVLHADLPILIIWVAVSLLITIVFRPYVFHNLICPFGALQTVFGRFAFFSKKVDADKCIGCKKCEAVCPSLSIVVNEDKKATIDKSLCHQCTNCTEVCPTDAISYKKAK